PGAGPPGRMEPGADDRLGRDRGDPAVGHRAVQAAGHARADGGRAADGHAAGRDLRADVPGRDRRLPWNRFQRLIRTGRQALAAYCSSRTGKRAKPLRPSCHFAVIGPRYRVNLVLTPKTGTKPARGGDPLPFRPKPLARLRATSSIASRPTRP